MNIFTSIRVGDSTSWIDNPTYDNLGRSLDSGDWDLTYSIRGATALDLTAVAEGSGWKTSISAVQSSTLEPGTYYWQAFAVNGSERITLGAGSFTVEANLFAESDGYDGRTQLQKDYDAINAAIRTMIAGGAVSEYTIGNRSLRKMDLSDLIIWRDKLGIEVAREKRAQQMANGLGDPSTVWVRFK